MAAAARIGAASGGGRHRQPVGVRPPDLPGSRRARRTASTRHGRCWRPSPRSPSGRSSGRSCSARASGRPRCTAKMAATLDEVADGRLILGLGTGWHEPEYPAFGYPFDHRAGRFEEALQIIVPLVHGERVTFHGRWHHVDDAVLIPPPPRPARRPGTHADPDRRQGRARAAADGQAGRRLEHRVVRAPGRAVRAAPRRPAGRVRGRGPRPGHARGHRRDHARREGAVGAPRRGRALPPDVDAVARAFDAWRDLGVGHVQVDLRPVEERTIDILLAARAKHLGGVPA